MSSPRPHSEQVPERGSEAGPADVLCSPGLQPSAVKLGAAWPPVLGCGPTVPPSLFFLRVLDSSGHGRGPAGVVGDGGWGGSEETFSLFLQSFPSSSPAPCKEMERSWQSWSQQKNLIFTLDAFIADRY